MNARRIDQRSILANLDERSVSEAARRESRNREKFLPPLSTFRWWARRTGAVNEAILDSAATYFGKTTLDVVDPFAGGGTIPLVALKAGHNVYAQDLNPWAVAGIRRMLTLPRSKDLWEAHQRLDVLAAPLLEAAYGTTMRDGRPASLVHTYRVAVGVCTDCGISQRQFPYSLLTLKYRKERKRAEAFLACGAGHVFEGDATIVNSCPYCGLKVDPDAIFTPRRKITCSSCGITESLSSRASQGWYWEPVLVERATGSEREFDLPSVEEVQQAEFGWDPVSSLPPIPAGAETSVLLRHGYKYWSDLYPKRQQVVTESLLKLCDEASEDPDVVAAVRMAIVGTAEFAGYLCRWDRFYLKCNDATAGHRFNFSTFVPELNVWGAGLVGRGTVTRRIKSMAVASDWFEREVVQSSNGSSGTAGALTVNCGDSAQMSGAQDEAFDLVITDPPYHDDVHYGELSLLFRAWAGLPMDDLEGEASTNKARGVNSSPAEYSASLVRIFQECRRVLHADGRLIFSYANRNLEAWRALFEALESAGFWPVACISVHSENETDFKKRDVGSCVEDLLMEFSPSPVGSNARAIGSVADDDSMREVLSLFSQVGFLQRGLPAVRKVTAGHLRPQRI